MEHLVIADDLTGANAVSVLLRKKGIHAITWLGDREGLSGVEAGVFTTDSRGLSREEAYRRVLELSRKFQKSGTKFFSKRIDSTMRGNIGAELDGLLDGLQNIPREEAAVICTPAYPDSGRAVENGILLINGIPLTETELADDPKNRIVTSNIRDMITKQSKYKVCNLYWEEMQGSDEELSGYLDQALEAGYRIIVCDSRENGDIVKLARAIRLNRHFFITADPGVLTAELAGERRNLQAGTAIHKVLAVVGSVNVKAREQLEELWKTEPGAGKVIVRTRELVQAERQQAELYRVLEEVERLKDGCSVITIAGDGIYPERRMEMTEDLSNVINDAFGKVTYEILRKLREWKCLKGLYTSGGDITKAVYERCGVQGIQVLAEVLPLAVYGELIGGEFAGLKVVTKGGSQGDRRAICRCTSYLLHQGEVWDDKTL